MAQIKKLSVATVYGKIDLKRVVNTDAPFPVMRVFGQAVAHKSGESNFGRWTALTGRFRAINPETGEVSEAAQLFLPEVALIPIMVGLAGGPVTFAIDVLCGKANNPKPGGSVYEYSWTPLLPPSDDDPLKRLSEALAALPAPGKAGDKPADDKPADDAKGKGKGK